MKNLAGEAAKKTAKAAAKATTKKIVIITAWSSTVAPR